MIMFAKELKSDIKKHHEILGELAQDHKGNFEEFVEKKRKQVSDDLIELGGRKQQLVVDLLNIKGEVYRGSDALTALMAEAKDAIEKLTALNKSAYAAFNKTFEQPVRAAVKRDSDGAEVLPPAKKSAHQGPNGVPVNKGSYLPGFNAPSVAYNGVASKPVDHMNATPVAAATSASAVKAPAKISDAAAVAVTPDRKKANPYAAAKNVFIEPVVGNLKNDEEEFKDDELDAAIADMSKESAAGYQDSEIAAAHALIGTRKEPV